MYFSAELRLGFFYREFWNLYLRQNLNLQGRKILPQSKSHTEIECFNEVMKQETIKGLIRVFIEYKQVVATTNFVLCHEQLYLIFFDHRNEKYILLYQDLHFSRSACKTA